MGTFNKILVANRGEIAIRVIRTARNMGYRTVAIYSEADKDAPHVDEADEAVCIGPAPVGESYLRIENIIQAAQKTAADAIHPGYGFLSENAEFARCCATHGIVFIGPTPDVIELMGSKRLSKLAVSDAQVPCIPGYQGEQQGDQILISEANRMGFPIMIKASAGGGGRGMRQVNAAAEMAESLKMARSEALSAFACDELILEKVIVDGRHIEIQVFADSHGNCVYLHERDCSVQRRHQKVVEEAPSPFVDQRLRQKMGEAAVKVARSCHYVGAGTVEFLVDKEGGFYFLEMNTRLQVEHPVTELVTGQDLVAWQIRVAEGQSLPLAQDDIPLDGHAVEVRLYAEDPCDRFLPQTGRVLRWQVEPKEGVRIDSGISTGTVISPHYDPMIAKVVAWGTNRLEACRKLASCLEDAQLLGFKNNKSFVTRILRDNTFLVGEATTSFLDQNNDLDTQATIEPAPMLVCLAAVLHHVKNAGRHGTRSGWRISNNSEKWYRLSCDSSLFEVTVLQKDNQFHVTHDGASELIEIHAVSPEKCSFSHNGIRQKQHFAMNNNSLYLESVQGHFQFDDMTLNQQTVNSTAASGEVLASMDGVIVDVLVEKGAKVTKGDTLIILEAMKMEHPLKSVVDGIIGDISVEPGNQVKVRQMLCNVVSE